MSWFDVLELIRAAGLLQKTIVGFDQMTSVDVFGLIRAAGLLQEKIVGFDQNDIA